LSAVQSERDDQLVLLAQQGNKQAFAALVDRYKGRVYRTLFQVVGDPYEAEDLAQEVFLRFYRSLGSYRGDAALTTWLHRLTLNLAFDYLRARKRRPLQVPLEPPEDREERSAPEVASPDEGPEEEALRQERRRLLHQAIMALPPAYREVVMLYHFQQLSYQEIADRLGAPVRTVETRLYRARHMLKQALAEADGGEAVGLQRGTASARPVLGAQVADRGVPIR
jgi:RNA polymerase sigma factor (sigma-70 family)